MRWLTCIMMQRAHKARQTGAKKRWWQEARGVRQGGEAASSGWAERMNEWGGKAGGGQRC